jgi:hypothetical protein
MPRKTTKTASASAARSSSKRSAPDTPARQSKRAKSTARKSYVEPDTDTDTDEGVDNKRKAAPPTEDEDAAVASEYDENCEKDLSSGSEPEESASEEDTDSKKPTLRGRVGKQGALPSHRKHADEKELWKSGAKLAPGTQLIIKKPKARDAGDTPYTDETIHPNTMLFLKDLAANNDRQWLKCKLLWALHLTSYLADEQDNVSFQMEVMMHTSCCLTLYSA